MTFNVVVVSSDVQALNKSSHCLPPLLSKICLMISCSASNSMIAFTSPPPHGIVTFGPFVVYHTMLHLLSGLAWTANGHTVLSSDKILSPLSALKAINYAFHWAGNSSVHNISLQDSIPKACHYIHVTSLVTHLWCATGLFSWSFLVLYVF